MQTSQINFTGFKNAGYCWINNQFNDIRFTRASFNTQLTKDDLIEFKKILREYPRFTNRINPDFVNIEYQQALQHNKVTHVMKLNGEILLEPNDEAKNIWLFLKSTLDKIKKQKREDFVVNKDYLTGDDCHYGIIYNDNIDDYIAGKHGTIGNLGNNIFSKKQHDDIIEILHMPEFVKGGADFLSSIINGICKFNN